VWNLGSFLGFIVTAQILSGTFLTFYYTTGEPFGRVVYIMMESNFGWIFRLAHFNGASLLFILLYLHLFKALFYFRYRLSRV